MVPLRKFENGEWAKTKDRFPKNSPALSQYIRGKQEAFFEMQNRYLKKNGIHVHIRRQNGKWTVVKGPMPAADVAGNKQGSSATGTVFAALHGGSGFVMQPMVPSHAAPPSNGSTSGGISETPVKTMHRAALSITIPSRLKADSISFKMNSGGKGWPPAALADWAAWGHKAPARFFQLWPELASGNAAPTGGHNL